MRRAGARPGIPGRSHGWLLGMTFTAVAAAGCAGPSPGDSTAFGTPPARAHHRLVAIPPGDVLLVGGSTRTDSGYVWFGDVWSWRAASESWVSLSPLPFTRSSHALAYDGARQEVVLIGGIGGPGDSARGSVWTGAGKNWRMRDEVSGHGWGESAACYDIVRERVVMFGGWDRDNPFRMDAIEAAAACALPSTRPPADHTTTRGIFKTRPARMPTMLRMTIWIDGDRTPKDAREIVRRAGDRLGIAVRTLVPGGIGPGDVVVTADEALGRDMAGRGIAALDPRGEEFVPAAHADAPEARELLDSIRALTVGDRGPPPYDERARRRFAAALDRVLTRHT